MNTTEPVVSTSLNPICFVMSACVRACALLLIFFDFFFLSFFSFSFLGRGGSNNLILN